MKNLQKNIILLLVLCFCLLTSVFGQVLKKSIQKERGYLLFWDADAIFIPNKEVNDSLFMCMYRGDTGYKVGEHQYELRLKEISSQYKVVTNYLLNDSLISESKVISFIPVEVTYRKALSALNWEITDLLFRYKNKDYIFIYRTYSNRIITSIIPTRKMDKIRYKKRERVMPE